MTATPAQILLREEEAAAMIALSARTLRDLRKAGKVDYVKVGASVRYLAEDLVDFAKRHRTCESTREKAPPTGGTRSPTTVADIAAARNLREKQTRRR